MKTIYTFNYDMYSAELKFEVDPSKFTKETAQETLDFFSWETPYDKEGDPIDEVLKKYAIECLWEDGGHGKSLFAIKEAFQNKEGYCSLDGSMGIELLEFEGYDFDEGQLDMRKMENQ